MKFVMALVMLASLAVTAEAKDKDPTQPGKPQPPVSRPRDVRAALTAVSCNVGTNEVLVGQALAGEGPAVRILQIAAYGEQAALNLVVHTASAYTDGPLVIEATDSARNKAAILVPNNKTSGKAVVKVNGKAAFPGANCSATLN